MQAIILAGGKCDNVKRFLGYVVNSIKKKEKLS